LKLQAVRDRIASDLHDEVGSSLSSITIGSQLAAQLSTGDNEKVKEIMARIGETSSESLRSMSDIVWAIDPKNDQGDALVKRMRRIANELLEGKGVELSFQVGPGVEELKLPMNARKELLLLYKEAVHNASKYSGATVVEVGLHLRNGALDLSVQDRGCGFEPALHPDGHGLGSMHRRAEALGTRLQLESAPGRGTRVGVVVDITRIRD
jgi:signal transduction histidine kinase